MRIFKQKPPTKDELYIRDIIKAYLGNEKVKILNNPISQEYYLINSEKEVSVLIKLGMIEISNHRYLYKRNIPLKFSEEMMKNVMERIDRDTENLKKELFHNEIDFLRNILKD